MKKLTVRLDDSLYKEYKKILIDEGLTAQEHLVRCIKRFVSRKKGEKEKKEGNGGKA